MNIQKDIPLAEKTTLRIGGNANYYAEPENTEEITKLFVWAKENSLPIFILGKGSNVIISDSGFKGLVIALSAGFNTIQWQAPCVICESGASLPRLVSQAIEKGLGGIEKLGGIPGALGGACVMNAGAFGQNIGSVIESVSFFDPFDQETKTFTRDVMRFKYRSSAIQGKNVCVTTVTLKLFPADTAALKEIFTQCNVTRRQKLPLDLPNCGSIFKNPAGQSAGALIEQCGLKGYECGGVKVSEKHANVIVNYNNGCADDVRKVSAHIQKRVLEKFGVLLEPEVVFVGEFKENLRENAYYI